MDVEIIAEVKYDDGEWTTVRKYVEDYPHPSDPLNYILEPPYHTAYIGRCEVYHDGRLLLGMWPY